MPRPRDILQRFRPAGTPGAASAAGVPADRVAEAAAELEPVVASLADTQAEAARIRSDARREAQRLRQEAAEQAHELVASAHRRAEAERAEAVLATTRHAEEETAAARAAAALEAEDARRRATERLPGYVDRAVELVRAAIVEEGGP
ncbi:MAG: hypothetical protein ACXVWU_07105 [Nocardioides sp.]